MSEPGARPPGGSLIDEFRSGHAIDVPPAAIEKELSKLWRSAAGEAGQAVTRACLWNLIVHAASDEAYHHAKATVDAISRSLPARVLVLRARRAVATAPISSTIEANWHEGSGGKQQIGSEEVTLTASGDAENDLAPIVRALLLPDVPTAALWLGGQPDEARPLDRELLRAAKRLVVECEPPSRLAPLDRLLGRVAGQGSEPIALGWLAAAPWRQLLAGLFDGPASVDELLAVEEVEVACTAAGVGAAHLFVGWLASRLRWREARSLGEGRIGLVRPGGAVTVRIAVEPPEANLDPHGVGQAPLLRVRVLTPSGPWGVTRSAGSVVLETPAVAWKQPLHPLDDGELWLQALSTAGRDRLFVEALRRAAHLPGAASGG